MRIKEWLGKQVLRQRPAPARHSQNTRPRSWNLEPLEQRTLLAKFTISNLSDGPVPAANDLPGSLRQALFDADATGGLDTIEFTTPSGTIALSNGQRVIADALTITGPEMDQLTIDAGRRHA